MDKLLWSAIVKNKAHYTCIECGSTELIQAHDPTGKHTDPSVGQCLCAGHHADKHPELPRQWFFSKTNQPYWYNVSAYSLAKRFGCCRQAVIQHGRSLGIPAHTTISEFDIQRLKKSLKYVTRSRPRLDKRQEEWQRAKEELVVDMKNDPNFVKKHTHFLVLES